MMYRKKCIMTKKRYSDIMYRREIKKNFLKKLNKIMKKKMKKNRKNGNKE